MSYRPHRRRQSERNPLVFFVLISCFGILFAGCNSQVENDGPTSQVTFTEQDLEDAERLKNTDEVEFQLGSSGTIIPTIVPSGSSSSVISVPAQTNPEFNALRTPIAGQFIVNNAFVNVRNQPSVTATIVERLERGAPVEVVEFIDNAWAKVRINNADAYISKRYLAKLIAESAVEADKAEYEGLYFVDFGFLNVRQTADTEAEKIGELAGQSIIKPLSMDSTWARVQIDGKEGFVAREYLTPFLPDYIVRQSVYDLPIITVDARPENAASTLLQLIATLQQQEVTFWTFRDFYSLLQSQQNQPVLLPPNTVILAIDYVTPETVNELSDAVYASNVPATMFIRGGDLRIDGITERKIINLMANGIDIQAGGFTGDDLRALTTQQVQLELFQTKELLEELTGKSVLAIGYPYGSINDRIAEVAADTGYLFGLSNQAGSEFSRIDFLQLPRIEISSIQSIEAFTGVDLVDDTADDLIVE